MVINVYVKQCCLMFVYVIASHFVRLFCNIFRRCIITLFGLLSSKRQRSEKEKPRLYSFPKYEQIESIQPSRVQTGFVEKIRTIMLVLSSSLITYNDMIQIQTEKNPIFIGSTLFCTGLIRRLFNLIHPASLGSKYSQEFDFY